MLRKWGEIIYSGGVQGLRVGLCVKRTADSFYSPQKRARQYQ